MTLKVYFTLTSEKTLLNKNIIRKLRNKMTLQITLIILTQKFCTLIETLLKLSERILLNMFREENLEHLRYRFLHSCNCKETQQK